MSEGNDFAQHVTDVIKEWDEHPDQMFRWRSTTLKLCLLVLEDIVKAPTGQGRSKDLARIRAISQLQSLTSAMEQMRSQVPVVCPSCLEEFNLP
jgi:hypothetical protein